MTRAGFDAQGVVIPSLEPGEGLACLGCGMLIANEDVDSDVGATVRECGTATCFGCQSQAGFERIRMGFRRRSVAQRWGPAISAHGWTPIPTLLLAYARDLGLSSSDLAIIAALEDHNWQGDGEGVFPAKDTIARRAGCSESTVSERLRRLECAGLIEVDARRRPTDKKQTTNLYRRDGLIRALELIATKLQAGRDARHGLADLLTTLAKHGGARRAKRLADGLPPISAGNRSPGLPESVPQESEDGVELYETSPLLNGNDLDLGVQNPAPFDHNVTEGRSTATATQEPTPDLLARAEWIADERTNIRNAA